MILKNVENKENKTATFQVESDAAEFESAVNGAYLKNKASINIPGFRKGKAPRAVVEGMYGAEVFYQDAMDELAPKAFEFGLDESKLRMVGTPSIVDVNVTDDRTASYTFEVTLYPEVTLGQYKGLEAERKDESVSDEDVDNELNSVRKRNARMMWRKTPNSREELPEYVERSYHEALVNALAHRDYLVYGSEVHIDIYDDRLEIYSPGGMPDGSMIQDRDPLTVPSTRRNPVLADVFNRLGYMERKGSGFGKILNGYKAQINYTEDKAIPHNANCA